MQYKQISPAVLIPRAFSSVGSTRAMWEELTTCCDLCGLSCEPPQSRTSPGKWENNTKSAWAAGRTLLERPSPLFFFCFLFFCDGCFSGPRSVSEDQMPPKIKTDEEAWIGFAWVQGIKVFYWSKNKGEVLTAKKISWKEIGDIPIQRESLGPRGCFDHG